MPPKGLSPRTNTIFILTSLRVLCLFLLAFFLPQLENGWLDFNLMADDRLELRPSAILNPNSRFFIGRLKSGVMLLVKNGPVGRKTGRSHITAFVSDDDGATWLGGLVLDERNNVSYPDAVESADGFIHVVHDRERTKAREILHHRFTEADVRAGRLVTPGSRLKGIVNKAGPK